jgi:zinc transport system substrate-binding protein
MKQSGLYLSKLQALDATYRSSLTACRLDTVVTSHNAFAYLAKRYNFTTLSVAGLSPEAEASSRHLAEIATLVKQKGIKHIFFETLVSPKVAETLAKEVGATTLVFNPIEGITDEERSAGMDYLAIMKSNLESLKIARQCQ